MFFLPEMGCLVAKEYCSECDESEYHSHLVFNDEEQDESHYCQKRQGKSMCMTRNDSLHCFSPRLLNVSAKTTTNVAFYQIRYN